MNEFNITVEGGKSVKLLTEGKYCDRDIIVTASGGGEENTNWFTPNSSHIEGSGITLNDDGSVTIDQNALGRITFEVSILPSKEGYILDFGIPFVNGVNEQYDLVCADSVVFQVDNQDGYVNVVLGEHFNFVGRGAPYLSVILGVGVNGNSSGTVTLYPNLSKGTELKAWQPYNF